MQKRDAQRIKLIQDGHKAMAMFAAGVSAGDVSKALGRSRMTVWRAVQAATAAGPDIGTTLHHGAPVVRGALERDPMLDGYEELEPAPADGSDLDDLLR